LRRRSTAFKPLSVGIEIWGFSFALFTEWLFMKKTTGKTEASATGLTSAPAPSRHSAKFRWLLVLGCLAISAFTTYFVLTTYVLAKLPDTIVGTWRIENGDLKGDKMTFLRDGTFTAQVTAEDGRVAPVTARVELHDKTLRYIFEMPGAGRQERVQTIKSLTPTEMIVEEGGVPCKLVRVK
jgi:hypothetical protein